MAVFDNVFVRANTSNPVKDGEAVSYTPTCIVGTGAKWNYGRTDGGFGLGPSGLAGFAQADLATKFRQPIYYAQPTGSGPTADSIAAPIF